MEIINNYFILFCIVFFCVWFVFFLVVDLQEQKNKNEKDEKSIVKTSPKEMKPLTKKQVDEIHKRGNITAQEKVKEWEDFGLCAPGDAIGSASDRCDRFRNCHECLCDYAAGHDEYEPLEFKYINYFKDEDFFGEKLE